MSVQSAWKGYQALDPQQKLFLAEQRIEASLTVDTWIPLLAKLTDFDRDADSIRKKLPWIMGLVLVAGIVLAIYFLSGAVFWTAIALTIAVGIVRWRLRSIDIPPAMESLILPWLTLLREDVEPGSEVFLNLNLDGNMAKHKRLDDISGERNSAGWKLQFFQDSWMLGRATLADGNRLQWEIVDLVRRGDRSKRNMRGKTKHKTKYKLRRSFDVHLIVRGKEYQLEANSKANGSFRTGIKTGEKGAAIRIRNQKVYTDPTFPPDLPDLVQTVSQAYRHISLPAAAKEIG